VGTAKYPSLLLGSSATFKSSLVVSDRREDEHGPGKSPGSGGKSLNPEKRGEILWERDGQFGGHDFTRVDRKKSGGGNLLRGKRASPEPLVPADNTRGDILKG